MTKHYRLEVKPAIQPGTRHKIEDVLKAAGFHVIGGGQHADGSSSDISFERRKKSGTKNDRPSS